jgi:protein-tyrosine phosphatase
MAEVLLRRHLAQAGVEATVHSAGLYPGGSPATDHGVAAMARRGLDLGGHRSRRIDATLVDGADLIVGMAREHVREAAVLGTGVLDKAFTLKELVELGEAIGPRDDHEALGDWLARVAATRERTDLLGVGHDDRFDVADPVGRGAADYEVTADLLDGLLARLVALGWPAREQEERSA